MNDDSSEMFMNEGSKNFIQVKGLKKKIDSHHGRRQIKSTLEKPLETSRKKRTSVEDVQVPPIMLSHVVTPYGQVPNSMPWLWNGEPQFTSFQALLQGTNLLYQSQCSNITSCSQVYNMNYDGYS
ncbi:hypothetical protein CsSME_00048042 [Camellia sinensis var. sinensis]